MKLIRTISFSMEAYKVVKMNRSSLTLEKDNEIYFITRTALNRLLDNPSFPAAIIEKRDESGVERKWIATLSIF